MRLKCLISLVVCVLGVGSSVLAAVPESLWQARGTEVYQLESGESVQFSIPFEELQVRAWILEVDGDYRPCSVNVLRLSDRSLVYQKDDESRHKVRIPWGRGEEIKVTLTADLHSAGVFTVKFLAPPPESAGRAFGAITNRALEALEAGEGARAESLLGRSIREGEDVGVASLLLASLYQQRGELERAAGQLDLALREDLPDDLTDVSNELAHQLESVSHRLPAELAEADRFMNGGDARRAARVCQRFLEEELESPWSRCEAYRRAGKAFQELGQLIRAQEMYDLALSEADTSAQRALALYRFGILQRDAGNPVQALHALESAREIGLPPDLDAEAAAQLVVLGTGE